MDRGTVAVFQIIQGFRGRLVLRLHVAVDKVHQVVEEGGLCVQEDQVFLAKLSDVAVIQSLNLL